MPVIPLSVVGPLCIVSLSCVYFCYLMCIVLLCVCIAVSHTLLAGLLARSQYPEGPATGHLDTVFSWFPSVYKQLLRWFPRFQVAIAYIHTHIHTHTHIYIYTHIHTYIHTYIYI